MHLIIQTNEMIYEEWCLLGLLVLLSGCLSCTYVKTYIYTYIRSIADLSWVTKMWKHLDESLPSVKRDSVAYVHLRLLI